MEENQISIYKKQNKVKISNYLIGCIYIKKYFPKQRPYNDSNKIFDEFKLFYDCFKTDLKNNSKAIFKIISFIKKNCESLFADEFIKILIEPLKNNKFFILKLAKCKCYGSDIIPFIDKSLLEDFDFILEYIKTYNNNVHNIFLYLPASIKNDEEKINILVNQLRPNFQESLLKGGIPFPNIIAKFVSHHDLSIQNYPKELLNPIFLKELFEILNKNSLIKVINNIIQNIKNSNDNLDIYYDKKFILAMIKSYPFCYIWCSKELKSDKDILLNFKDFSPQNPLAIYKPYNNFKRDIAYQSLPNNIFNEEIAIHLLNQSGRFLLKLAPKFREDKKYINLAIKTFPICLTECSNDIKDDEVLVYSALVSLLSFEEDTCDIVQYQKLIMNMMSPRLYEIYKNMFIGASSKEDILHYLQHIDKLQIKEELILDNEWIKRFDLAKMQIDSLQKELRKKDEIICQLRTNFTKQINHLRMLLNNKIEPANSQEDVKPKITLIRDIESSIDQLFERLKQYDKSLYTLYSLKYIDLLTNSLNQMNENDIIVSTTTLQYNTIDNIGIHLELEEGNFIKELQEATKEAKLKYDIEKELNSLSFSEEEKNLSLVK